LLIHIYKNPKCFPLNLILKIINSLQSNHTQTINQICKVVNTDIWLWSGKLFELKEKNHSGAAKPRKSIQLWRIANYKMFILTKPLHSSHSWIITSKPTCLLLSQNIWRVLFLNLLNWNSGSLQLVKVDGWTKNSKRDITLTI
jgi:hypothetical protein